VSDLRICFVSLPSYGYFNTDYFGESGGGGAKRQIYLLTQELKADFDVSVVVGDYGQPEHETRDGVSLYRAYTPNEGATPRSAWRLFRAMRRADADVYVYRGHPKKAGVVGLFARILDRKFVYNVSNDSNLSINYDDMPRQWQWLFRRVLDRNHAVIAQTEHQQHRLRERFDVTATVVPNGYPPADDEAPADREFVLWVGRLDPEQKRPDLFLDCAAACPDIQFRLVGVKTDEDCYERVRTRSESLANAEFLGPVSPNEIHNLYRDAIALVNTSRYEGFPNTFLEAWRFGTPVVSLTVDSGRYLDGTTFTGYAKDDTDELAATVRKLASDPEFRSTVGSELRDYFERTYRIDAVAQDYATALSGEMLYGR